ncbi:RbsD / FucU transport protein family protein [bacterium A37T11]|nr:RbsD / FucU transport protein family protein [bacterium A37T11]
MCLVKCGNYSITAVTDASSQQEWKTLVDHELPLFGHRNWILVVDKAFPALTSPGVEVLYAHEDLLSVLNYVVGKIDSSTHIRRIVYTDTELQFLNSTIQKGIDTYRDSLKRIVKQPMNSVLHDSLFMKLKQASNLFKVLIIKTNETRAYSSVFLQLDCAYWSAGQESELRKKMK